jgi:hypothetical protein
VSDPTAGPPLSTDDEGEKLKKEEFERNMEEARRAQNLPEGAVPEQRPQAFQTPVDPHSRVRNDLVEAEDPRGGALPAMGKSAYDRASSSAQAKKAARESISRVRLYPGARAFIDNEGTPDHGRAVAVNRVAQWGSFEDGMKANSGDPALNDYAAPAVYECTTRDGRSELMLVDAEHLRTPGEAADWGRTAIS